MLVFGLVLSGCSLGNSPSGVVKKFYNYAAAGKVNDAFNMISNEGQNVLNQYGGGVSSVAKLTERIRSKGGIKSIKITDEQIIGDTATVKFIIKYGDGSTEQDDEKPIKQDGKWKLTASK